MTPSRHHSDHGLPTRSRRGRNYVREALTVLLLDSDAQDLETAERILRDAITEAFRAGCGLGDCADAADWSRHSVHLRRLRSLALDDPHPADPTTQEWRLADIGDAADTVSLVRARMHGRIRDALDTPLPVVAIAQASRVPEGTFTDRLSRGYYDDDGSTGERVLRQLLEHEPDHTP